ncbi:MAG: SDR family oxidoreductase [Actinomycetes bacterium]
MKIAVAGGTGLVGRQTVEAVRRVGHDPLVLARSAGVDLTTGAGLPAVLDGVDAVIDVTNTPSVNTDQMRAFFAAVTGHLLAAEHHGGVRHHVVLSIVGLDRLPDHGHYAGKREQERLSLSGPVPASVVRATQFFDFAAQMVNWTLRGQSAALAPLLLQPVAVTDVADVLVEVALGEPVNGICELAGPETQDLVDMARRTLAARGESLRLIPTWRGRYGVEMAGEVLLPRPDARLAPTTFDHWLTTQTRSGS